MDAELPNFVILGAAKAATTWLARGLDSHPDLFMAPEEIHYFSRQAHRCVNWYASHFSRASPGQVRGERSNTYLYVEGVPSRLGKVAPNVKLVVSLRDPVERAYSDYCMQFRRGAVSADVGRYLSPHDPLEPWTEIFLGQGLYASHLLRFLQVFDPSQLQVVFFEDVVNRPQGVLEETLGFLGLRSHPDLRTPERLNTRTKTSLPPAFDRMLRGLGRSRLLAEGMQRAAASKPGQRFRSILTRPPVEPPPLAEEIRFELRSHFEADIQKLETLIERDLSAWR